MWNVLFEKAKSVLNPRSISDSVEVGIVACAILSKDGNVYVGVSIDMACSIGMCAERNAISSMITMGESKINKLVCIGINGDIMLPCGVCREFIMQIDRQNVDTEILTDLATSNIIKLGELLPNYWK